MSTTRIDPANERTPIIILLVRMLVTLAANTAAIVLADRWLDGFTLSDGPVAAPDIAVAAVIGLFGAVAAPLAVRFAFPVVVYSLGLASIAIDMLAVYAATWVFAEVQVATAVDALLVALLIVAAGNTVSWLLSLDDEATFTRAVVRRQLRRAGDIAETDEPGVLFLEIDGCSHGVLLRAMRAGWMPNLAAWLREGHRLERWHTDLSSQTGASQAGLLLGSNDGLVAFRWWERDRRQIVVSSKPADAMLIEDRLGTGEGLLAGGGASRNNLVGGDATLAALTLSRLKRPGGASRAWAPYFANPNNVLRTALLVIVDIVHELLWTIRYRRRRVHPRLERKGWKYPLVRAATTVVLRDLATEMVVADMVRGVPSVYATYVGYDEVAHHDGIERPAALEQLRLLDRTFARIARARAYAPRPYHVVVLSDHGQSQGATFLQQHGESLEDVVRRLADTASVEAYTADVDSAAQLSGSIGADTPLTGTGGRAVDVDAGPSADILVMASGCLGLAYLRDRATRATRRELEELHPGLVEGLAHHPGVGWVLVADDDGDGIVVSRDGTLRLSDGEVTGRDPLADYDRFALAQIRRHHRFEHMPDILAMGRWDAEKQEVPAFEELIGSHGGMGGEQTEPFVMFPDELPFPDGEELLGAGALHDVLKSWTPKGTHD